MKVIKYFVATAIALSLLTIPTISICETDNRSQILERYGMDRESLKEVLCVIKAESHNTYDSKLATANVILNQKEMYPSLTMSAVLRIPKQWETITNNRYKEVTPDKDCLLALIDAMNGVTNVGNAVYFYNPNICKSDWHETQRYIATIGDQRYFERVV